MTASAAKIEQPEIIPATAETLRAYARDTGMLVHVGLLDLHDGVDRLQDYAVSRGLVAEMGQDAVQQIIAEALIAPPPAVVPDLPSETAAPPIFPDDQYEGLSSTFAAACRRADEEQARKPKAPPPQRQFVARSTIDTAKWLARHRPPEELQEWLAQRGADERAAIVDILLGGRA